MPAARLLAPALAVALLLLPFPPASCPAAAADDWVGRRFVLKPGVKLRINYKPDERKTIPFSVYEVIKHQPPWLLLKPEPNGLLGYVLETEVTPFAGALDDYTALIRSNPSSWAYGNRGIIWAERKEYDIAIADYNEAIRLDPRSGAAFNNRGLCWEAKGDLDKAMADYDEAIRLDPNEAMYRDNRGMLWGAKGELDKALADCNEAIRLDSRYAYAYSSRAEVWGAKGDLSKALADFDKAIELDPKFAKAYAHRGGVWRVKGELDKALADYDEAIRLDSRYAYAYSSRAEVWGAKGDLSKALADFDKAIELDPKNPGHYNSLAWLLATCPDAKCRDGKRVVAAATKACELSDWKAHGIIDTLAAAMAEAGDFEGAVRRQEEAIRLLEGGSEDREEYVARLELYKAGQPYREEPEAAVAAASSGGGP